MAVGSYVFITCTIICDIGVTMIPYTGNCGYHAKTVVKI